MYPPFKNFRYIEDNIWRIFALQHVERFITIDLNNGRCSAHDVRMT